MEKVREEMAGTLEVICRVRNDMVVNVEGTWRVVSANYMRREVLLTQDRDTHFR